MSCSYLPYHQFESCARELASISDKIGDGWELKHIRICSEPEKVFLVKSITPPHTGILEYKAGISEVSNGDDLSDLAGACEVEEPTDPAVLVEPLLPQSPLNPQHTVSIEYHIVYSDSYEVPILFFNATHGNGRQLVLDDIWKIVSKELTSSNTDRWSLISQQEHPLLSRPFYHIHPCHTAKVMGKALQTQTNGHCSSEAGSDQCAGSPRTCCEKLSNYLLTWLSTFGPLVGLRVPMAYLSSNKAEEWTLHTFATNPEILCVWVLVLSHFYNFFFQNKITLLQYAKSMVITPGHKIKPKHAYCKVTVQCTLWGHCRGE